MPTRPSLRSQNWLNNLAINVLGWDKGVNVYRLSTQPDRMPRINLLLIEKAGKHHFTWIKDLNRLLYDQSKYRGGKHLRAMPARIHKGGSAGSQQTRLSRDWADYSQGGDAGRGENQGHLSEPPQAVEDPFHHLCGLWGSHHQSWGAWALPRKEQYPENATPWGLQLLLHRSAVWWQDGATNRIPRPDAAEHS